MKAEPGQTDLQPQKEEDIEKAIWVKKGDLKNYKEGCFTMIWDLLAPYADAQTTTTGA